MKAAVTGEGGSGEETEVPDVFHLIQLLIKAITRVNRPSEGRFQSQA